jgi:hypothetical protein
LSFVFAYWLDKLFQTCIQWNGDFKYKIHFWNGIHERGGNLSTFTLVDQCWLYSLAAFGVGYQEPHSQCPLKENSKFMQNFKTKNNTLIEIFWLIFLFNICHCNSGLLLKLKNYYTGRQNRMYFSKENSQNLHQNASELCEWCTLPLTQLKSTLPFPFVMGHKNLLCWQMHNSVKFCYLSMNFTGKFF